MAVIVIFLGQIAAGHPTQGKEVVEKLGVQSFKFDGVLSEVVEKMF